MTEQQVKIIDSYVDTQEAGFFKRTLARKIVMENPGAFEQTNKEVERVRCSIRYRAGAAGDRLKGFATASGSLRENLYASAEEHSQAIGFVRPSFPIPRTASNRNGYRLRVQKRC